VFRQTRLDRGTPISPVSQPRVGGATGRLRRYIVIQRTVDRRRGLAVERAPTTTYDNQLTKKSIRRESVGRAGDRPNDSLVVETATDDGRATVHRWTTPDD